MLPIEDYARLLAEEYDPALSRQLGNTPQAFSHAALVNTAFNLSQAPRAAKGARAAPRLVSVYLGNRDTAWGSQNNVQLGKYGRYRTNVWTYAGVNTFRRGRMEELASHPTVKPCALVMDALKDCSKPQSLVLDPFGGSGTTLIAAAKTKRRARLLELDPTYVDVAVRRWEALFKAEARHAETGLSFNRMKLLRSGQGSGDAVAAEPEGCHGA